MEGFREESSDGDGDDRGDDPASSVTSISVTLAVYHLHGLGACALDARVLATLDGTVTDDTGLTLNCKTTIIDLCL